jgi:hypothetical protein
MSVEIFEEKLVYAKEISTQQIKHMFVWNGVIYPGNTLNTLALNNVIKLPDLRFFLILLTTLSESGNLTALSVSRFLNLLQENLRDMATYAPFHTQLA